MKKLWAAVIVGVFMMGSGLALAKEIQGECPGSPDTKREQKREDWQAKRLDRMAKDLNLSVEQKDKIAAIFKENDAKAKVVMDKVKEDMDAIRATGDKQVKEVLTPEQVQKYDKIKEEMQKKVGEGRGKGRMEMRERDRHRDGPPPQGMPRENQ